MDLYNQLQQMEASHASDIKALKQGHQEQMRELERQVHELEQALEDSR